MQLDRSILSASMYCTNLIAWNILEKDYINKWEVKPRL